MHQYHGALDDFFLRLELDTLANRTGSIQQRCRNLFLFLRDNPEASYQGRPISEIVVEEAARLLPGAYGFDAQGGGRFAEFLRALERDGFAIDNGRLRRALPAGLDLPAADDEVHALLDLHGFETSKGHLDQAIDAHARGQWAATNGQLRTFFESLLDEIAVKLDPGSAGLPSSENRRQRLATLDPPLLRADLNEWSADGKNFINGVLKRLHPDGPHPGLSDEEDSTFRLHLVLLISRLLLRRLPQ